MLEVGSAQDAHLFSAAQATCAAPCVSGLAGGPPGTETRDFHCYGLEWLRQDWSSTAVSASKAKQMSVKTILICFSLVSFYIVPQSVWLGLRC